MKMDLIMGPSQLKEHKPY